MLILHRAKELTAWGRSPVKPPMPTCPHCQTPPTCPPVSSWDGEIPGPSAVAKLPYDLPASAPCHPQDWVLDGFITGGEKTSVASVLLPVGPGQAPSLSLGPGSLHSPWCTQRLFKAPSLADATALLWQQGEFYIQQLQRENPVSP